MPTQTVLHRNLVESAANTFTSEEVEIPNTVGAKQVKIDRVMIQLDVVERIATTFVELDGAIGVGQLKAAMDAVGAVGIGTAGIVAASHGHSYGVGTLIDHVKYREFFPNRLVPKSADGKFYVSICVKGANNTTVKNCKIAAEFTVQ